MRVAQQSALVGSGSLCTCIAFSFQTWYPQITLFKNYISVILFEPEAAFHRYALLLRNVDCTVPVYTGPREFKAHTCNFFAFSTSCSSIFGCILSINSSLSKHISHPQSKQCVLAFIQNLLLVSNV